MKRKTARRFLERNEIRMIDHKTKTKSASPHFLKRWREATRILLREE
jgi:hypothetical protein